MVKASFTLVFKGKSKHIKRFVKSLLPQAEPKLGELLGMSGVPGRGLMFRNLLSNRCFHDLGISLNYPV